MAKGLRASSKKANRTKLRAKVFGPVEQARAERLHAKMLETIAQPKPERSEMDTAEDANTADDATKDDDDDLPKDMDVDGAAAVAVAKSSTKNKDKSQTRKQLRRKSSNKISFPASKGKGALKPFHGQRAGPGRIGKRRL